MAPKPPSLQIATFCQKTLDQFVLKIQLIEEQEQEESCEEISEGIREKLFQFQS